jgi:muramoyltetrapeptide carboxypeptidase
MDNIKTKLVLPARLRSGDTIGIVAPASPFDRGIFDQGVEAIRSMGFRIFIPDELFREKGYLAGSDEHRAKLVNQLFLDDTINAIVCAKGGFGTIRVLPFLDFGVIANNPKVLIGHSDITALVAAIYTKCSLVTFHGPLVTTLAEAPEITKQMMLAAISSDSQLEIKPNKGITIRPGKVEGPVIGGNLTTLCHLVGTPFEPMFKRHILFLEDRGEANYRIDRMFFHMKLAGCFEGLVGLILGSFENCGPLDGIYRIVAEIFQDYHIPILAGLDVGHSRHNITIPLGIRATLDSEKQLVSFHQPATIG